MYTVALLRRQDVLAAYSKQLIKCREDRACLVGRAIVVGMGLASICQELVVVTCAEMTPFRAAILRSDNRGGHLRASCLTSHIARLRMWPPCESAWQEAT
jgi:hypothetical protein